MLGRLIANLLRERESRVLTSMWSACVQLHAPAPVIDALEQRIERLEHRRALRAMMERADAEIQARIEREAVPSPPVHREPEPFQPTGKTERWQVTTRDCEYLGEVPGHTWFEAREAARREWPEDAERLVLELAR